MDVRIAQRGRKWMSEADRVNVIDRLDSAMLKLRLIAPFPPLRD